MATKLTVTSNIDHTTNAGYIAWRDEFVASLITCGAVQTADTGQYTIGAGTKPAIGAIGDNAILRTPDSRLYIKFEFGTDTGSTVPKILYTIGTGSNGTGTITGQTNTASTRMTYQGAPASTVLTYTSHFCVLNGYMGISWKENGVGANSSVGMLIAGSSVDSSQAITTDGFLCFSPFSASAPGVQSVRTASPASANSFISVTANPAVLTSITGVAAGVVFSSTDSAGNNQAYLWNMAVKDVQPFLFACCAAANEVTLGTTFTVALIGSTQRTYIGISPSANSALSSGSGTANVATCMLWE